jgi:hypothetical protein
VKAKTRKCCTVGSGGALAARLPCGEREVANCNVSLRRTETHFLALLRRKKNRRFERKGLAAHGRSALSDRGGSYVPSVPPVGEKASADLTTTMFIGRLIAFFAISA